MLTLSGDLPVTATSDPIAGAAIANVSGHVSGVGALASSITFSDVPLIESIEVATIATVADGLTELSIPATVVNIADVTIDGTTYLPTADEEGVPDVGEFYFDEDEQTATVNVGSATPVPGAAATYRAIAAAYPVQDDRYTKAIPQFLRDWNISGEISLSRSFEGSPSGSLEFTTARSNRANVRESLRNGTIIKLFGTGYAVSDLQLSDDRQGFIQVSIGLQGAHDLALERSVLLRTDANTATVSMDTLARRAGIEYRGPAIDVPIDREASLKATTTVGQELGRSRSVQGFAFYSNPDAIRIKKWAETKVHAISDADVMSNSDNPITISYGGQGNVVKGLQLAEEYLNRELELDTTDTVNDGEGNGRKNTSRIVVSGEIGITSASLQLDCREPTNSFDLGGATIKRTVTQYINEFETWVEEDEFGYAYASSQVYQVSVVAVALNSYETSFTATPTYSDTLANGRFMRVRTRLTRTFFDNDNYLIKRTIKIRELKRYKSESNQKEALALKGAVLTGQARFANQQLLNLYEDFFWTERIDTEEWTLEEFADRYPDVDTSQFDYSPKFATAKRRRDRILESTPNPETIAFTDNPSAPGVLVILVEAPPLVTGSDFRDTEEVSITYPESGLARSRYRPEKDAFKLTRTTENKQGPELQQGLAIAQVDERLGRPSEHSRLPQYEEDGDVSGNDPDEANVRLILRTPNTGLTDDDPIEGTISFPGADTRAKAIAAAETDISILNTQGVELVNLSLVPTRNYEEGDRVNWNGKMYVLLSIDESYRVETTNTMSVQPYNVTLGRLIQPVVTVSEISE